MKFSLLTIAKISVLSALAIAPILLSGSGAAAETKGTDANYVGVGVAAGATGGGQGNDYPTFGGNIQGRAAIPNTPVSVRGAVLFSDQTSAIMPMLSYDAPIANNTNLYVGAGYSFVEADGKNTPLGNRDAVVVTTGVETQLGQNIILYGDAKVGFKAYQNSSADAVSFQAGAGYRF